MALWTNRPERGTTHTITSVDQHPLISIDPHIHHGQPCIRGSRVPVARLVGAVAGGDSIEQVAADYALSIEDVRAALTYAQSLVAQQQHYPLPKSA